MPHREYVSTSFHGIPKIYEHQQDAFMALVKQRDPNAVAAFLHPDLDCGIPPEGRAIAMKTAEDPYFLKYVLSPSFKYSLPIEHYILTLLWLSKYTPIGQTLIELGFIDTLLNLQNAHPYSWFSDTSRNLKAALESLLDGRAMHNLPSSQQTTILVKVYLNSWSVFELVERRLETLLPVTDVQIAAQYILVLVQSKVNYRYIPQLLNRFPIFMLQLTRLNAVETLSKLTFPSIAAFKTLKTLRPHSFTSHYAITLLRKLISGNDFHLKNSRILDSLYCDNELRTTISNELYQQFTVSTLTQELVAPLQRVLHHHTTKQHIFKMGLLDPFTSKTNAILACTIPEFVEYLVFQPSHPNIIPLLHHLIATNSTKQLNIVVDLMQTYLQETSAVLSNEVCASVVKTGIPTDKLPKYLQQAVFAYLCTPTVSRDKQAPWYIDAALLPSSGNYQDKYISISGLPQDLELVTKLYQRSPVPGYDIKQVTVVHSEHLFNSFAARIESLQERSGKEVFAPHWKCDRLSQEEVSHRQRVMDLFHSLAVHKYSKAPDVSFVLAWHGTRSSVLHSLFSTGFANLASTDAGFFGKGLYTTPDAEYAFRVYSSGALLLNWVAVYSPLPVIAQDEPELAEKGNFRNYDAHFAPVYSPNHPKTSAYHACESDQDPQYSELVVFESSQMLARYIVELQPNKPREILPALEEGNGALLKKKKKGFAKWSVDDVCKWFSSLQLTKDYSSLLQENGINGEVLMTMTQQDWKDLGMNHFGDSRLVATKVSRFEI